MLWFNPPVRPSKHFVTELEKCVLTMHNICIIVGEKIKGRVIGTTLGCVQYCSLSPNDSLVAVCVDIDIVILQAAVSFSNLMHSI